MKKSKLFIICLIIIAISGVSIVLYKNCFFNIDSNNYLSSREESQKSFNYHGKDRSTENSKSFEFRKFDGKWSLMHFTSPKGNKINIIDNTKINKGKFYIVILDLKYNIIAKKNEVNQKENITFTTPKEGKYIIRIIGANASGNFNIKVNASKKIEITHIDFFD